MAEAAALRVRVAELETELRFTKVKLAEAHAGTQYLLETLSLSRARGSDTVTNHYKHAMTSTEGLEAIEEDLFIFEAEAGASTTPGRAGITPGATESGLNEPTGSSTTPYHHADESSEIIFTPAGTTINGNETTGSQTTKTTLPAPKEADDEWHLVMPDHDDVFLKSQGGEESFIPDYVENYEYVNYLALDDAKWHASSPTPIRAENITIHDCTFTDKEHNAIMGAACFIEDMTDAGRANHWAKKACQDRRHDAAEYALYYEKVIRPAYLNRNMDKNPIEPIDDDAKEELHEIDGKAVKDAPQEEAHEIDGKDVKATPDREVHEIDSKAVKDVSTGQIHEIDSESIKDASIEQLHKTDSKAMNNAPTQEAHEIDGKAVGHMTFYKSSELMRSLAKKLQGARSIIQPGKRPYRNTGPPSTCTIFIRGIEVKETVQSILKTVSSEMQVRVTVVRTAQMKTNPPMTTNSAFITFRTEKDAMTYLEHHGVDLRYLWSADYAAPVQAQFAYFPRPAAHPLFMAKLQTRGERIGRMNYDDEPETTTVIKKEPVKWYLGGDDIHSKQSSMDKVAAQSKAEREKTEQAEQMKSKNEVEVQGPFNGPVEHFFDEVEAEEAARFAES